MSTGAEGGRLTLTAIADRAYWANDCMVATAGRNLDFFVAHDTKIPMPGWLKEDDDNVAVMTIATTIGSLSSATAERPRSAQSRGAG